MYMILSEFQGFNACPVSASNAKLWTSPPAAWTIFTHLRNIWVIMELYGDDYTAVMWGYIGVTLRMLGLYEY